MTNRENILRAIKYIQSSLKSDINVLDIAKESYCSLYHFIRLFKNIVGIPPKKYLLQRRLTESVREIQNSNKKIVSIAFDFQFGSHEVFTRSFQRYFGTTPSKVKKGEAVPAHLLTRAITEDYIFQSEKARNILPELIDRKEQILVGLSYFVRGDLEGLDLSKEWSAFMKSVGLIKNRTALEEYFQIQFWSENQDIEGMHFFIGTEVTDIKNIAPQFVVKIIPQGTYLKFIHKGISRNVGYTYRYI